MTKMMKRKIHFICCYLLLFDVRFNKCTDYASALKFSPEMKRGFLALKEKQEKKKISNSYVLIGDRFYSLEDINTVLLLTGVPLVELYLEKKMKKVSK